MSNESNIILITNESTISQILKPKLVLLRDIDNITTACYKEAIAAIKANIPDSIIIYCNQEFDECLNLIKKINADELTKDITILLTLKSYNQDFILSAYDENISDFFMENADDAEILMRTIWGLKKNSLRKTVNKQHCLLEKLEVINSETDFYNEKFSDTVFDTEISYLTEKNIQTAILYIATTPKGDEKLSILQIANTIKKNTRTSDIVAHAKGKNLFILLPKTNITGALCVWDKIKNSMLEENLLRASVCEISNTKACDLKSKLINLLSDENFASNDIIVSEPKEENGSEDWVEKIKANQKNFKLFKQAFTKKLDKVIAPVFFQMQKLYEEQLFKTKIEQYSNSTQSSFILKRLSKESELKITYPGFSKINIDISHKGLDSPENSRISLDLTELDEGKLTSILEKFIIDFQNSTKN